MCYFNPRSPGGERPRPGPVGPTILPFQSTLPVWGATETPRFVERHLGISIHAPRVGSDLQLAPVGLYSRISIHAPRVGSDVDVLFTAVIFVVFQSTLPVWGATDLHLTWTLAGFISIHAPRVGSDTQAAAASVDVVPISIHAPRVGSDLQLPGIKDLQTLFQSTLPVWGATGGRIPPERDHLRFQSTLPVWGATGAGPQAH